MTTTTTHVSAGTVAYDYDRQQWVRGDAAVPIRLMQLRAELELLSLPADEAHDYLRFIGHEDISLNDYRARLTLLIAQLDGMVPN